MSEEKIHLLKNILKNLGQATIYFKFNILQVLTEMESELNVEQFIVLYSISKNEEMCQRDLAKVVLKDRSNISRIINCLEKYGYVDRIVGIKNKCLVKKISITKKGKNFLGKILSNLDNVLPEIFRDIPETNIKMLLSATEKLKNNLSETVSINI